MLVRKSTDFIKVAIKPQQKQKKMKSEKNEQNYKQIE